LIPFAPSCFRLFLLILAAACFMYETMKSEPWPSSFNMTDRCSLLG
jgi:hypothetical protein